jgi:hypothetical protein
MQYKKSSQPKVATLAAIAGAVTIVTILLAVSLFGRVETRHRDGTFYGPEQPVGRGQARSYITLAGGKPVEIGVAVKEEGVRSLEAGPKWTHGHHHPLEHILQLPKEAAGTPFKFVELDWNRGGHEPAGIYDSPHFDFHFYTITKPERDAIDPADRDYMRKAAALPPAGMLPATYVLPPPIMPVPRMGVHWVHEKAAELNGKPFTHTMIMGSWDGRVTFIEPMITRAFLESKQDVVVPIEQARCYSPAGWYPTQYSIRYDAEKKEYRVALLSFEQRGCDTQIAAR